MREAAGPQGGQGEGGVGGGGGEREGGEDGGGGEVLQQGGVLPNQVLQALHQGPQVPAAVVEVAMGMAVLMVMVVLMVVLVSTADLRAAWRRAWSLVASQYSAASSSTRGPRPATNKVKSCTSASCSCRPRSNLIRLPSINHTRVALT